MPVPRPRLTLPVLAVLAVLQAAVLGGCAGARGALPAAAPELTRLNRLLADLAERLTPALVQVRREPVTPPGSRGGWGSGFLVDPTGVVVSNAHVVGRDEEMEVRLFDGRRFRAGVIGRDARADLVLLGIDGVRGLPTLPLGDSDRVRVGELVLALGHPFGLEHTVSFGIVSRRGLPAAMAAPGRDALQTDAAINPGNSGGPLVNMAGEAIGVNNLAARNGSIGFAIPSNLVRRLVSQLPPRPRSAWPRP